jgi:hypothetical protein
MLFHQIRDHLLLLPIEPAGEGGEEHEATATTTAAKVPSTDEVLRFGRRVGRVLGHYAVARGGGIGSAGSGQYTRDK